MLLVRIFAYEAEEASRLLLQRFWEQEGTKIDKTHNSCFETTYKLGSTLCTSVLPLSRLKTHLWWLNAIFEDTIRTSLSWEILLRSGPDSNTSICTIQKRIWLSWSWKPSSSTQEYSTPEHETTKISALYVSIIAQAIYTSGPKTVPLTSSFKDVNHTKQKISKTWAA